MITEIYENLFEPIDGDRLHDRQQEILLEMYKLVCTILRVEKRFGASNPYLKEILNGYRHSFFNALYSMRDLDLVDGPWATGFSFRSTDHMIEAAHDLQDEIFSKKGWDD